MAGAFALAVLPLMFLIGLVFYVGLFYLGCILTGTPLTPFFKTTGLVALAMFAAGIVMTAIVLGFSILMVLFYHVETEPAQPPGRIGAMVVNLLYMMFSFCVFVVIAGAIYNWGLNIETGQGIATVQHGIPTAFCLLLLVVGIVGYLTGAIKEAPPASTARTFKIGEVGRIPTPTPVPTPVRPGPVIVSRPAETVTPVPTPEVEHPTPAFEIPRAPVDTDPPVADPALEPATASNPYRTPGTNSYRTFNRSAQPQPEMSADADLFPNAASRPNRFGAQQPSEMAAESLPFVTSPVPGAEPVPTARPRPESLLGRADWALEYGQIHTGLQHLYAAAVVDDAELVWQNVAWSETFKRPMFCVMWGVGVDGAVPAGADSGTATAGILPAVRDELVDIARRSVFAKHADQLVQDLGIEADRRKLLAKARDAGIDVLAVVSLQRISGAPGRGPEMMLYVYVFDVATGRSLWKSDGLSSTRYLIVKNQGQDLGVELAAEAGQQASRLCGLTPNCPLEAADARKAMRSYVDSRPTNPLEGLFRLNYLHKQEKITDLEKSLFLNDLVGKESAEVLAGGDTAAKQQLVARWLPELRTPTLRRPVPRTNRPFGGFSTDEPATEEPPADPDESGLPRRPATSGAGGNRFFID